MTEDKARPWQLWMIQNRLSLWILFALGLALLFYVYFFPTKNFKITDESLKAFKTLQLSDKALKSLSSLMGVTVNSEKEFSSVVLAAVGNENLTEEQKQIILSAARAPSRHWYDYIIPILFMWCIGGLLFVSHLLSERAKSFKMWANKRVELNHEQELIDLAVDALPSIDVPDAQPALLEALRGGDCVVVIGSGMSEEAGVSTWSSLLKSIIEELPDKRQANHLLKMLRAGLFDEVIDSINSLLEPGALAGHVVRTVLGQKPRTMEAYSRLAELPVSAVVSLNLDDLAAKALRNRSLQVFVPREAERCLDALSRHELFVFMLNGTTNSPEEILLSHQNLMDAISRNDAFRDLLKRLYYSRPLFFLGVSLSGLKHFFRMIDRNAPPSQRHFALVEVNDSTWQPIAMNLESQFGLEVLPFTPNNRDGAIAKFLRRIPSRLESSAAPGEIPARAKINRIELRNIGPFTECALDLDPGWTVILGDNGVGKSTVLRALAVCMCGKASESFATRLLKGDKSSGSIVLHMGNRQYVTTITRKSGGGVAIDSPSGVPLENECILAVGFSALRTVGWQRGKAKESGPQRPIAADLISLTSEEPDPRLDGIKQWIVRLDHLKAGTGVAEADRKRYGALFDRVFEIFKRLAIGIEINPAGVNPKTGEIIVQTKDGLIPFESLSQGTLSLVGWAGALMQRLYETAPAGVDPLQSAAIVLVDEIDAHMHPAWQQTLVNRLSETFENAQFIATSHSPLVVGGLEPRQVYRFERDAEGVVQITQPEYSLKGLGAAGLLTSGLFGLASHLDTETAEALDRKRQLTAKQLDKKIKPNELKELSELEARVGDIDSTQWIRDPMYQRFVGAVTRVEAESQEARGSTPTVLTKAEKERGAQVADEIVRELMRDEENNIKDTGAKGKPS